MIRLSLGLLFLMAIQFCSYAETTRLPAWQRKTLDDTARFHEVRFTTNLPPAVVELCSDGKGLAERGKNWEAGCVIGDSTLPTSRLLWAMTDGIQFVVHYERGGRAHSFHVLVATFRQGEAKARNIWRGAGDHLKDYPAFLNALRNGHLDDRLDYAH